MLQVLISFLRRFFLHFKLSGRINVAGDRANMRPVGCDPYGVGPGVRRLADGGRVAARPVHALHRPGGAHAAPVRHQCAAGMLCRQTRALH